VVSGPDTNVGGLSDPITRHRLWLASGAITCTPSSPKCSSGPRCLRGLPGSVCASAPPHLLAEARLSADPLNNVHGHYSERTSNLDPEGERYSGRDCRTSLDSLVAPLRVGDYRVARRWSGSAVRFLKARQARGLCRSRSRAEIHTPSLEWWRPGSVCHLENESNGLDHAGNTFRQRRLGG
jgi:hypothetical protein